MPRRKAPEDLSVEELRRLLIEKRRGVRRERLEHFRRTGRVVDEDIPRPTLDDVWNGFVEMRDLPQVADPGRAGRDGLRVRRDLFVSWKEARAMEAEGSIAVAGHSHRHRSVFTGPEFKGVFQPDIRKRTFDRIDAPVPFGLPRFRIGPALASRAFVPSAELYDLIHREVPQNRGEAREYFADQAREEALLARIHALGEARLGALEGEDAYRERLTTELSSCRETLERELGHPPLALAWPWGRATPEARDIALGLGFRILFTTQLGPNLPGRSPESVRRFKARAKSGSWFVSRLGVWSRPFSARVYAALRPLGGKAYKAVRG